MKKTATPDYPLLVRPLRKDEGGGYLCEFPDLPGCYGDGPTVEAAIADGRAAAKAWLSTARQIDRKIPSVSIASGQWRMRAPRSLHLRLQQQARNEGVSLNTLAVSLIAEGLGRRSKPEPLKGRRKTA